MTFGSRARSGHPTARVSPAPPCASSARRLSPPRTPRATYALAATREPGRLILFAELPNFRSDDATIHVTGPLSTRIDFTLTPTFAADVTVIAEVPMLDATDDVSRIQLAPEQVSVLPSLGERDLFRAFQLLPGVSGSNEASSGLYVRGGTPDQNRVEYDGFRVYHVDHLFGYFSAFNMDAVDTVELSKGGFEARHGGALSSVMQITGKSGRLDRAAGSVGAGLLSFNGVYETPLFDNRGSGLLAVRRSFQGPLYDKILNLYDNNPTAGPPGGGGFGPGGAFPISRSRAHTHRRHGHPLQTVPSAGLIERPQEKNRVDALR